MDVGQSACKLIKYGHQIPWSVNLPSFELSSFPSMNSSTTPTRCRSFRTLRRYLDNRLGPYALKCGKLVKKAPLLVTVFDDDFSIQVAVSAYDYVAEAPAYAGTGRYIALHHLFLRLFTVFGSFGSVVLRGG